MYIGDQGTELQAIVSVIKVHYLAILPGELYLKQVSVDVFDSSWVNALFCNSFANLRDLKKMFNKQQNHRKNEKEMKNKYDDKQ